MDIVLAFLSSGGGRADKNLGEYVDKVLKMSDRAISRKVEVNMCIVIINLCIYMRNSCLLSLGHAKYDRKFLM